jgi:two-component system KDP operon response regulator KdpE
VNHAPTILLIDDDETLVQLVADHLRRAGYQTIEANDGESGLRRATADRPDLVVLDVMMPRLDGWQVCERLRNQSTVPIILLTAKAEEADKLRGFHLKIDDYVTKPFSFAELTARVGAVLARTSTTAAGGRLDRGDLSLDFETRRVSVDGRPIDLTPTEYRVLEVLAHSAGRPVSNERLLEEVWGPAYAGEIEYVKHFIWALRKKLEDDPGDPRHLLTERGFGYRLE